MILNQSQIQRVSLNEIKVPFQVLAIIYDKFMQQCVAIRKHDIVQRI